MPLNPVRVGADRQQGARVRLDPQATLVHSYLIPFFTFPLCAADALDFLRSGSLHWMELFSVQ